MTKISNRNGIAVQWNGGLSYRLKHIDLASFKPGNKLTVHTTPSFADNYAMEITQSENEIWLISLMGTFSYELVCAKSVALTATSDEFGQPEHPFSLFKAFAKHIKEVKMCM